VVDVEDTVWDRGQVICNTSIGIISTIRRVGPMDGPPKEIEFMPALNEVVNILLEKLGIK
jgi:hypothetical protein